MESSLKEEDCVLMQCREKNQLCVARLDVCVCALVFVSKADTITIIMCMLLHYSLQL